MRQSKPIFATPTRGILAPPPGRLPRLPFPQHFLKKKHNFSMD